MHETLNDDLPAVEALPPNPATELKTSGSNPRQRGREKLQETLVWLATFVWSTEPIILQRLGVERRGWMQALEKKGLVMRIPSGTKTGYVWALTKVGLATAQSIGESEYTYYPKNPLRRQQTALRHDLCTQLVVVQILKKYPTTQFFNGSKFATADAEEWQPDCILVRDNLGYGVELERTQKFGEARDLKLARIVNAINRAEKKNIILASHLDSCLEDYSFAMRNGVLSVKLDRPETLQTYKLGKDYGLYI